MMNNRGQLIYDLEDFQPQVIDANYLNKLGAMQPTDTVLRQLEKGSRLFIQHFQSRKILPDKSSVRFESAPRCECEVHNYTGRCPTNTFELNPTFGACQIGCLYCLVTDGIHSNSTVVFDDYHELVRGFLESNIDNSCYYYLTPKSDAFQSPLLEQGVTHNILREFICHYKRNPTSKVRLFIASKAGIDELLWRHEGDTIIDLLSELRGKVQFNASIGIMPSYLHELLEPYAPSLSSRLSAISLCQEHGIHAFSVLTQPILIPFLTNTALHNYMRLISDVGIVNFKPEFLTVCPENLSAIAQVVGYFRKDAERNLYDLYLSPSNEDHKKQRDRTAPSRAISRKLLLRMKEIGDTYGMSISICYWVRKELQIEEKEIPLINKNGFQCLGYQVKLFEKTPNNGLNTDGKQRGGF